MSPLSRARRLLARPGAWLEASGELYLVRVQPDRRGRVMARIDEAAFRALVEAPGLKARNGGGWSALPPSAEPEAATPPGRPGVLETTRSLMRPDGGMETRRVNLGVSPVRWLAVRTDPSGRPWLTPAQVAAAERLAADAEIAASGPSLTMRWDALPRSGAGGGGRDMAPGDRAMAASRRVEAALSACGPARGMVEAVCVQSSSLRLAEQDLGLKRRDGKTRLAQGLTALAAHYRIG